MVQFNEISFDRFLLLLGFSVLLFILHKFINRYVIRWAKDERKQKFIKEYLPLAINVLWILLIVYFIYKLTLANPIVSIAITGLVLLLTWHTINDFVQGTIFKIQKGNIVDQSIKIGELSGIIVKMGITKMDIQLDNGETLHYPYSKLYTQVVRTTTNVKHFKNCIFTISVPFTADVEMLKKQILVSLLNSPWVVSSMPIKMEVVNQDAEKRNIKINAYTLDDKFIPKIQHALAESIPLV